MKELFRRLRAFLKGRDMKPGSLGVILGIMVLLLVVCLLFGGKASREQIFPVYISEVVAANTGAPNQQGRCCDFIEIYNSADYPVDLSGFQLGDMEGKSRYAFPIGTVIGPGEYMCVYCDKTVRGESYAAFEISRVGGEMFYLIAKNGAVVDKAETLPLETDQAMVRREDRTWVTSMVVTPGRANDVYATDHRDVYNQEVSPVRITELSSGRSGYLREYQISCDWIELHNTAQEPVDISGFILSDNVGDDKFRFPQGTVLAPDEYFLVNCTDQVVAADVAPFGLSRELAETVILKTGDGRIVEIVETMPMTSGSMSLQADGSWIVSDAISAGYENSLEGNGEYLLQTGAKPGNIRISEVMAADQMAIADSFGSFPDWVELYNASRQTIDLSGWHLTDDAGQSQKWVIPNLVMQPGERTVIFCSGRGVEVSGEVHTPFSLSAGGESLSLYTHGDVLVDAVNFPASADHVAFTFSVDGKATQTDTPTPGYPNDQLGYEEYCAAREPQGGLAIWEVMTANDRYLPQRLGSCYDWVELRNVSDAPLDLSEFFLTDDPRVPDMHRLGSRVLQPGERIAVILSGEPEMAKSGYEHTAFKLDAREDQLLIYDLSGKLVDYVFMKQLPVGTSYGRRENGDGFFYMVPTPEQKNDDGFRSQSGSVKSNYAPGVYSGAEGFTVTLEAPGDIYYTTDGSVPTNKSQRYTKPIELEETAVLRAVCIEEEKLGGEVYTATFVVGDTHTLPVVSLVTDPEGLWGADGVYRNGDSSVKETRLPSHVAYSGPDGSFALDCAMHLHGDTTVTAFNKKSFALRFMDSYDGALHYDVFEDGEVTSFRSLILRTAHEGAISTQMHDVLMAHVAAQGSDNVLTQKYKYVSLYLNGEYWGLYAIRERHSQEHYASYRNVPAETVEINRFMIDKDDTLHDLYDFVGRNSLKSAENYAYVKSLLDVESFADWVIYQAYVCNVDIYANIRYYRSPEDGLWRMGLADMDLGMMGQTKAFDELCDTFHHGRLVRALMTNKEFQDLLAARMATLLEGPLSDENMVKTIKEIAAVIRPETQWEQQRWGTPVKGWEESVDYMIRFCDGRAQEMIDSLCAVLNLSKLQREYYFGSLE